ncbi:serine proteinase [Coprinellus micaceus]|uniref:Serine proteinase n=1 Tax=Coprinellus micaceus TaxID=71717 RepID=A0A4Y7SIY5_COPMI|nr:serine proteinase [Coprinellus micaceus]
MKFLTLFCAVSSILIPVIYAGPTPAVTIQTVQGHKTGRHIVMLKPGVGKTGVLSQVSSISGLKPDSNVTAQWGDALNGFSGNFDAATLAALAKNPGVAGIVEDGIVKTTATALNEPWGLSRINSKARLGCLDKALTYTYKYDDRAGQGVDIYIIDTGIRITHQDFGGRAKWSATFGGYAGTAVGGRWGVAKKANVFAIKVLSDSGSGSTTDVISGMNYALSRAKSSGRPSVVSMSLGGSPNAALDAAARNLVASGLHLIVAAGNSNVDAVNSSPARVAEVITVGASTITDERSSFSNYGTLVDVFAPGTNIQSAWKDSDTSTNIISGTSMATPHVAGLIAYLISVQGNITPAAMSQKLKDMSLKNMLNPYSLPSGTANRLVSNQYLI